MTLLSRRTALAVSGIQAADECTATMQSLLLMSSCYHSAWMARDIAVLARHSARVIDALNRSTSCCRCQFPLWALVHLPVVVTLSTAAFTPNGWVHSILYVLFENAMGIVKLGAVIAGARNTEMSVPLVGSLAHHVVSLQIRNSIAAWQASRPRGSGASIATINSPALWHKSSGTMAR